MVSGKAAGLRILCRIVLTSAVTLPAGAAAPKQAFVTWDSLEVDKCASIWLIKRLIAPDAQILFYQREEEPPQGIQFDTPEAEFRRYHNRSTYETLLQHYQLNDKNLIHIGRIIHDIEVNTWQRKALDETPRIEFEVKQIILDRQPQSTVKVCLEYFDKLLSRYR